MIVAGSHLALPGERHRNFFEPINQEILRVHSILNAACIESAGCDCAVIFATTEIPRQLSANFNAADGNGTMLSGSIMHQ